MESFVDSSDNCYDRSAYEHHVNFLTGALPVCALGARLWAATDTPSWAPFLPPALRPGIGSAGSSCLRASALPFEPSSKAATLEHQAEQWVELEKSQLKVARGRWFDVWILARQKDGCRIVQAALEEGTDAERIQLAKQLHTHVWEALRCPHANYVLQKCITTMRPDHSQFIIDELMQSHHGIAQAARHRFGCRVLERLLEHCQPGQVRCLINDLLADGVELCTHQYGNYVMQHVLDYGEMEYKKAVCWLMEPHVPTFGVDCYACAVLGKALQSQELNEDGSCIDILVSAILRGSGLLTAMARTRHGHITAKLVVQVAKSPYIEEAQRQLSTTTESLRSSRYGRFVIAAAADQQRGPQPGDGA